MLPLIRIDNVHELAGRFTLVDPDRPRHVPEHIRLEAAGSTSDHLMELADEGAREHTLVVAREQHRARGGSGRWHAPPGGLWFSTLWRPKVDACSAALLTLAAGWGLREGVRRFTGIAPGLKWPNDLIIDGRKAGGVLVEGRVADHDVVQAVVGVGLNVNNPLSGLPEDIAEQATSLQHETSHDLELKALLDEVVQAMMDARDLLETPDELVSNVTGCWTQKGREVAIDTGYTMLEGTAVGIDEDGWLIVRTEEGAHRIDDPSIAKFVRVV